MPLLDALFSAPARDWTRFLLFLTGIVAFIWIAEKARTRLGWSAEVTRKLVHVGTGVLIVASPLFFESAKPLLWMAVLFTAVNFAGVETGMLKGLHDTRRKSYGTVFYPLTFFILVAACWQGHKAVLILSMMVLSFSDAAAAAVGELLRKPHGFRLGADKKSLEGSAAMFLVSFVLVRAFLPGLALRDGITVSGAEASLIALAVAVLAAALEAVSSGGSDNLTAPLGAAFVLQFMLAGDAAADTRLMAGFGLALVFALLSWRLRFLDASGAVAAFILAVVVFGAGGWAWALPILVFFVTSSLLSKAGRKAKKRFDLMFEKTGTRDAGQVLANGGVAGLAVAFHGLFPHPLWYAAYLGALASVNADTWATELGTFSKTNPRLVTSLRPVAPGTSGAVSLLGLAAAAAGALIIALSGLWSGADAGMGTEPGRWVWALTLSGFTASLVDSLAGALVQAQYRCPVCGKTTEKRKHCGGAETAMTTGLRFVNNDVVNGIAALSGALIAAWILR